MDILIIADFLGKMDGTDNSRFLYLANMLCKEHDVEILTSDFDHGTKSYFTSISKTYPFKITMVHEGLYKKNVSLRRFYGHYVWGKSVQTYLSKRKKPDVIYAAVPPLLAPYFAAKYCEKNNVRFIIDIQDLWPEAFKMVFKLPIVSDIVFAPFTFLANGIYKRADEIIAVSDTYVNRAFQVNNKCKKGVTVFLGTQLAMFDKFAVENAVKKEGEIWLGYCGSMGDSYDLQCVIDALAKLKNPPKLIAMGDGEKRKVFEDYAKSKGVKCLFTGELPYDQMCGRLVACDMVVNPIVDSSAASIINKHSDYAASGLPVLNTQNSKEYRKLVEEYNMGFNCKNGDPEDLAEKIQIFVDNKDLRIQMGQNSRRCAEEKFDRANTYSSIRERLFENGGVTPVKKASEIWLAYCGTLGASYDLNVAIDAVRIVNDKRLKFIIMGDGERREEFERRAKDLNVVFTGKLPYHQMCGVLASCDITINPIMPGAAQSIINKHADYAASGLPVISTQENEEYKNLIEVYQMGFNCKNGDAIDMAEKLKLLVNDKDMRIAMGKNSRKCAEERFDRGKTYYLLVEKIISLSK